MCTQAKYAKLDPSLAIASLFRPIIRGRRPRAFELQTKYDGFSITWRSFEQLDAHDQTVLYAVIALALLEQHGELSASSGGVLGRKLRTDLKPLDQAVKESTIAYDTTYYKILEAAGMGSNKEAYDRLKNILNRLADVSIRVQRDGYDWKMHLISYAAQPDGKVSIALSGRMAAALTGQNITYDIGERRQLTNDTEQILHAWISAWLRKGRVQSIRIDKLAAGILGETQNEGTCRKRRERVLRSLERITEVTHWTVQIKGRGAGKQATIARPAGARYYPA